MAGAQTKAATTTTLATTSNGSVVTTVGAGTVVTLTASVTSGTTALTRGQVNFCDASAQYCMDIHLLGTVQLTSKGVAMLKLRPGIGSHSYKAVFLGASNYAASSSVSSSLTVTGIHSTTAAIGQSGSPGNYTLTATVTGITNKANEPAPTGIVSFVDTTTNNTSLGTGVLGSSTLGMSFFNSSSPSMTQQSNAIAAADFNGDGIQDLAVSDSNSGQVLLAILLGNGDGTFTATTVSPTVGQYPDSIAVGDFNSDGSPDLAVTSVDQSNVTILLGNGDGTFSANAPNLNLSGTPQSVAVGDFNGDGISDLAVVIANSILIFLGNGDGTFTPTAVSPSTGTSPINVAVGDFNSDGKADLAVTNSVSDTLTILLGKGDGTFQQTAVSPATDGSPDGLAIADFNGDGVPDIAVSNYDGEDNGDAVMILLGVGNGTFQTATPYSAPSGLNFHSVAVADFNGDGIADLAVGEFWHGFLAVLLGQGDGAFATAISVDAQSQLGSGYIAVADFDGDGIPDLAVPNQGGTVPILLTQPTLSVTASISGISPTGVSPQQVYASYPGNSNYVSSQSATTALLAPAAPPVFTPASGTIGLAQPITLGSTTPGASIYYQASGVIQTNGYVNYFAPIVVPSVGTLTMQAYTVANNYGQSATSSATYAVVVGNPVPILLTMSPAFTSAGGPAFTITIGGSGFVSSTTIYWGSTALATTYVTGTQLTGQVTAAEIATPGIIPITVQTLAPGGGISTALQFEVDSGGPGTLPSFTTTTATVTAGSTATFPVTLPSSATNVAVSCLNLPSGASCSYSASAGTLTLATAISTPSGTYQITAVFQETLPGSAAALAYASFLLFPLAAFRRKQRKQRTLALAFLTLALFTFAQSSCGGGSGGGTIVQTHQATSSGLLTLTVR